MHDQGGVLPSGLLPFTTYRIADVFRMRLLANIVKHEHNVVLHWFDEKLYIVCPTCKNYLKHKGGLS